MSDAVDLLPLKQRAPAQGDLADVTGGHLPGARILLLVNYVPSTNTTGGTRPSALSCGSIHWRLGARPHWRVRDPVTLSRRSPLEVSVTYDFWISWARDSKT
jgi:hypothetical protein